MFNAQETDACRRLIKLAIDEDLGVEGDLTSRALIPADRTGKAVFISRASGTLAGVAAASLVFEAIDPRVIFRPILRDGEILVEASRIASVSGSLRSILAAERIALNFMQHLCAVATQTRRYVQAVAGISCQILDTRKTTPGWRLLEKYAVRCGGGSNHRMGLYGAILIKDNHLAGLRITDCGLRFAEAVRRAGEIHGGDVPIELEVEDLEQFDAAIACKPRIIMLDNMSLDELREAVRRRNHCGQQEVLLEASGGITLLNVRAVAETGVDRISIGALTHSVQALDIALEYLDE
jgi:nicotinate-nucleotide pyrophosphorylase (carboxylating)